MSLDRRFMDLAGYIAGWSKDRSRKTAAVIVDDRDVPVAMGCNEFPRGVDDTPECRHQRPDKYHWTEHAERNAIYNAAATGVSTRNCRIYIPWYPCVPCARAIIQSAIREVIAVEPDWSDPKYGEEFAITRTMFAEAGTVVRFMAGEAPVAKSLPGDRTAAKNAA